jgi:hypothetical protein
MPRPRYRYRNGDPIHLRTGCNSCSPSRINGVLCHESGCPDAWRDRPLTCISCGATYYARGSHGSGRLCHRHTRR